MNSGNASEPARGNGRRGVTLIEVAVALGVGALVALAIFGLFRAGVALGRRSAQTIAAGEAALGLEVIVRTLREASHDPEDIRLWPAAAMEEVQDAVVVRTARGPGAGFALAAEGQPAWIGWVGFVHDRARQAVRMVDFAGVDEPSAPPWEGGRVVVRQAKDFTVRRDGERLAVALIIAARESRLTLETAIWPRNR